MLGVWGLIRSLLVLCSGGAEAAGAVLCQLQGDWP